MLWFTDEAINATAAAGDLNWKVRAKLRAEELTDGVIINIIEFILVASEDENFDSHVDGESEAYQKQNGREL